MEHLCVLQNVGSVIDEQLAGYENDDGSGSWCGGLGIKREHSVHDLGEWESLDVSTMSRIGWAVTNRSKCACVQVRCL